MGKTGSSCPAVQPPGHGASLQRPLRSLRKKHCENQGGFLQFDRQAPGRISVSPTLRRLRGSGCGTWHSPPQQDALQVPTWGSWREPAGSLHYLSKSLPGSPEDSPHSLPPRILCSRLPSDPERTLNAADSFEPQPSPSDKQALPKLRPINEGCLHQACPLGREGHSLPSPTPRCPGPQAEESHPSRYVCSYFLQCCDMC
uniref:Uncharacterized protein n=2 Tax=Propithecus coquereli TaxID=379532 RepID=A0A2K6ET27_PROCO